MYDVCFYQLADYDILNNNDTFVLLEGNVATITGYAIYGPVRDCITLVIAARQVTHEYKYLYSTSCEIYDHVFYFKFLDIAHNSWYQTSSRPYKICFCSKGSKLMKCNQSLVPYVSVYPGQTFSILAVGMGIGISPALVRSRINAKYDIIPELQSLRNACAPLNYTILAPENISGILVQLSVQGSYSGFIEYLNLTTLKVPPRDLS